MGVIWWHKTFCNINQRLAEICITVNERFLTLRAQCQSPVIAATPAPVMYPRPLEIHRMVIAVITRTWTSLRIEYNPVEFTDYKVISLHFGFNFQLMFLLVVFTWIHMIIFITLVIFLIVFSLNAALATLKKREIKRDEGTQLVGTREVVELFGDILIFCMYLCSFAMCS